jgi:hypothetical protein
LGVDDGFVIAGIPARGVLADGKTEREDDEA